MYLGDQLLIILSISLVVVRLRSILEKVHFFSKLDS
jgi:hypothetical protein